MMFDVLVDDFSSLNVFTFRSVFLPFTQTGLELDDHTLCPPVFIHKL